MAKQIYVNNITTRLSSGITAVGTSITVDTAFPDLGVDEYYIATLDVRDKSQPPEIIKVTGVNGNTLTVVRGQEGTTAQDWVGTTTLVEVRLTAGGISTIQDNVSAAEDKLAGIEEGATADQTGAEIKALYEAEADTNVYTDAEKSKLASISENAKGINDAVAELDSSFSGDKTQALHNLQQADLATLAESILAITSNSAIGEFGADGLTLNLSTTEQVVPFNIVTQSTNTDVVEITNGTGIVKEAGTYTFISTVELEDIGANGDVATITFNLRNTTTNEIYYSQDETIEISNFDRETIPFNSLMIIPDSLTFPVEIDINVVCSQTGYRLTEFKSVVSAATSSATITTDHNTLINRDAVDSHPASAISALPVGSLSATNVQAALEELDTEVTAAGNKSLVMAIALG